MILCYINTACAAFSTRKIRAIAIFDNFVFRLHIMISMRISHTHNPAIRINPTRRRDNPFTAEAQALTGALIRIRNYLEVQISTPFEKSQLLVNK